MPSREAELPMNGAATSIRSEHSHVRTHAVTVLAAFVRRLCRLTHTRGGGGNQSNGAPEIGEGNTRKTILLTQRLSRNYKSIYCPGGTIKYNNFKSYKRLVRPRSQILATYVRAVTHTYARKSATHRRPSIAAHDRRARPRRWVSLSGSDFPDYRVTRGKSMLARTHAWPGLPRSFL